MKLRSFSIKTRKIFERFVHDEVHELAGYSFINIFIWRCLYDISWSDERGCFCVFFKDKVGCFMPLPPLGPPDGATLEDCFRAMEEINHNPDISRVENIEENNVLFFKKRGFSVYEKFSDYAVPREGVATLAGTKHKHRRNLYNFFIKHYEGVFRNYTPGDRQAVLALFARWKDERKARHDDGFYRGMLDDSELSFRELLLNAPRSSLVAKVVSIGGKVAAFTSGVALTDDIFCVNFEIADHAYKGLAQFIFTEFAKTIKQREINIMDDSGIASLKKTKMFFKSVRLVPSYTAVRKKQWRMEN